MSPLHLRAFDSLPSCAHLRADMARLNAASPRPCPFSTFEFLTTHTEHNGVAPGTVGARPLILMAFRGEELVGYLPLRRVPERVLGRAQEKIECLVTHDIDRPHLVSLRESQAECAELFYRSLVETDREWTFLELEQQDEGSPLYPVPRGIDVDAFHVRLFENASNATIELRYPTLHDYFRAFSKKMRNNVGRYARRLFDAGDVELLASSDPAALPRWLDVYRSVEARSWKKDIAWVVGEDPHRIGYFRGLMRPEQPMRISIHVLALNGCPIAAIINGRFLGGMHALQIAYDEGFRDLDPGAMMLLISMKKAIDERCEFYNLLSGYGYFKERWLARITPSRSVQLYRKGSMHHVKAMGGAYKRQIFGTPEGMAGPMSNPAKEEAVERGATAQDTSRRDRLRSEGARMIAEVRTSVGPVEALSHQELVEAMPFSAS